MSFNQQNNNYIMRLNTLPVFILYTIATTIVYLLPYTKFTLPYIFVACLMLLSLPFIMLKRHKWFVYGFIFILLSAFILLMNLVNGNYSFIDSVNEMIRNIRFFIPVFWAIYSLHYCNDSQRKWFLVAFGICISVIMFQTLKALSENEWVTRLLAEDKSTSSAEINAYRMQNVGGFEFSYMIGIVTLCLVWTTLNAKKLWIRISSALLSILCFYYIIRTMYTTLLLLTSIGIFLLILLQIKNLVLKIFVIVACIGLIFGLSPLFAYLSEVFGSSLLADKFMHMHDALEGANIEVLGKRPEYMLNAIKNWSHSPIWGGYGEESNAHSMIFTMLEQNGIIGLAIWGLIFQQSWSCITVELEKKGISTNLFHVVMLFVLGLSVLNPIGYAFEVPIMAFYVVPTWLKLCNIKVAEQNVKERYNEKMET